MKWLLRPTYYSHIITYFKSFDAKFMQSNSNTFRLLPANNILIEYVDSASCNIALEIFKNLKIRGNVSIKSYASSLKYSK
jgi:hypothetical protein